MSPMVVGRVRPMLTWEEYLDRMACLVSVAGLGFVVTMLLTLWAIILIGRRLTE